MARIPGRPKQGAPAAVRAAYAAAPRLLSKMTGGKVTEPSEPITLHAWAPAIMSANSGFELALMRSRRANTSPQELAPARGRVRVRRPRWADIGPARGAPMGPSPRPLRGVADRRP